MTDGANWITFRHGQYIDQKAIPRVAAEDFAATVVAAQGRGGRLAQLFGRRISEQVVRLFALVAFDSDGTLELCSSDVQGRYPCITARTGRRRRPLSAKSPSSMAFTPLAMPGSSPWPITPLTTVLPHPGDPSIPPSRFPATIPSTGWKATRSTRWLSGPYTRGSSNRATSASSAMARRFCIWKWCWASASRGRALAGASQRDAFGDRRRNPGRGHFHRSHPGLLHRHRGPGRATGGLAGGHHPRHRFGAGAIRQPSGRISASWDRTSAFCPPPHTWGDCAANF